VSSLTPLPTRTLNYEDIMAGNEVARVNAGVGDDEDTQQLAVSEATNETKVICDVDNCPGRNFQPGPICIICEADLHMECFYGTVWKLNKYPQGCHNEVFCSDICCPWYGNDKVDVVVVQKECSALQGLLKKQLVELAWIAQVWVTQKLNKKSLQVSKAMMVLRLMAKKINDSIGTSEDAVAVPTAKPQKTVHVRFRLINCLFSDESSCNANSADSVDRAALDAGAVGSNFSFWTVCAEHFNNGFPVDSVDGPLFANKVHFSHPTIDGHPETVDPSQRSTFSSSVLNS
jgi:hypothetical protein